MILEGTEGEGIVLGGYGIGAVEAFLAVAGIGGVVGVLLFYEVY
jgi:hypothetical protein